MLYNVNYVKVSGNLANEPQMSTTKKGLAFVPFTLVANTKKGNTTYMSAMAWGKTAKQLATQTHKGAMLYVIGHLTNDYVQNQFGDKEQRLVVVVNKLKVFKFKKSDKKSNQKSSKKVASK